MMARWNASIVVILVGLVGLGDASIASAQGRTLVRIVPGTGLSALEASFLHSETERRLATMVVPAGDPIPVARIAELLDMLMGMALHGRR